MNKTFFSKLILISALVLGSFSNPASAAGLSIAGNVGIFGGSLGYGGRLGYRLSPSLDLGVSYLGYGGTSVAGISFGGLSLIMADLSYHMDAFYIGGMVGVAMSPVVTLGSIAISGGTGIGFGARTGYDFTIASGLSIGPEVRLYYAGGLVFAGLATVKYSF